MQPPLPAPSIPRPQDGLDRDSDELARFREAWKAEVRSKRGGQSSSSARPEGFHDVEGREAILHALNSFKNAPSESSNTAGSTESTPLHPQSPQTLPGPTQTVSGVTAPLSTGVNSAIALYRQAIEKEESGRHDDALALYRQAFRKDANVDKSYHRAELLAAVESGHTAATTATRSPSLDAAPAYEPSVDHLAHDLASIQLKTKAVVTGTLASLLARFPDELAFAPEEGREEEGSPLTDLPEELIVYILRTLDPTSIERFAQVSRKARVISLDVTIWRELVMVTYKPPQVPDVKAMIPVVERLLSDYRRVYVEHPRVRTDGVYIAICHYVRPGLSENHWVNVTHLITYHRYVRFFPNGQVLSLLANEGHSPAQIIPLLKPSLRMKGLFLGTWKLSGTTVHISNLLDASGRYPLPTFPDHSSDTNDLIGGISNPTPDLVARYVFTMTLTLRSRPLGRWNKLDITSYDSVNTETGDTMPVGLKRERPFWFSKVRSYAT